VSIWDLSDEDSTRREAKALPADATGATALRPDATRGSGSAADTTGRFSSAPDTTKRYGSAAGCEAGLRPAVLLKFSSGSAPRSGSARLGRRPNREHSSIILLELDGGA